MTGPVVQPTVAAPLQVAARYAAAVGCVAAGLLVAGSVHPLVDASVFLLAAVLVAAWFSGLFPALLAALLATLALDYFFTPPLYTFTAGAAHLPRLAVFSLIAVLFAGASAGKRRADRGLRQARDELETKVAERTAELREQANLLNLTHDTVFVRDMEAVIRYWNRGAQELYGWTADEAVGRVTHDLLHTVFPEPLEQIRARLAEQGRWEGELVHTKRDGTRVVVASRWALQRAADGRPIGVLETNNDISQRKLAEEALRESKDQWQAVFEHNPTMYFMIAPDEIILSVNPFGAEQLGYTVRELVGQPVTNVFLPEDHGTVREHLRGCLARVGEVSTWEMRKVRKDGAIIWVRETANAMQRTKGSPVVLIACEDISARKRAEEELEELAGRLISAQEQERSRIGRELHDHISQLLGVLTIRIDQLAADAATPAAVVSELQGLRQTASEITDDIHSLSHRLHSSALDYLGLVPAVQRLISEFSARHGIAIDFVHEAVPATLSSEVALCLFRVTEESLTNIAKHSQAKSARVEVKGRADGIHLAIEDAGTGFDVDGLERKAGLGFVSMRERLRAVRGRVRVESAPARGTRIAAWVPVASLDASASERPAPLGPRTGPSARGASPA